MYIEMNYKVENFCKIVNVAFDMAVPGVILPKAMYSFYMYFCTNLEGDAFESPLPFW